MHRPLFDDATPATPRPTQPITPAPAAPQKAPGQMVVPGGNAAPENPYKARVKAVLATAKLSGEGRARAERMALQLLPPDREKISEYGRAALDSANMASDQIAGVSTRAADLCINEFLSNLAGSMRQQDESLIQRWLRAALPSVDMDNVEQRIRVMIEQVKGLSQQAEAVYPKLQESATRLSLHIAALSAVVAVLKDDPDARQAAASRQSLLEAACSMAEVSIGIHRNVQGQIQQWAGSLERALYVSLPSWKALHATKRAVP